MKKLIAIFWFTIISSFMYAQNYQTVDEINDACATLGFTSNEEAELAVDRILEKVGLFRNFVLQECPDINNAVAKVIEVSEGYNERYILYDNNFFDKMDGNANTDWASMSILAHEIGHHLNGHSLNNQGSNHKYELEADFFSGAALAKLGATLAEAQSAVNTLRYEKATRTHPAKVDRLKSVKDGWYSVSADVKIVVENNDNIELFNEDEEMVSKYTEIGSNEFENKNYNVAAEAYIKAFQYSAGKDSDYLSMVGGLYILGEEYNKALKYYLLLVKNGINKLDNEAQTTIYENIAQIYYKQGNNDKALQYFKFVLTQNPNNSKVLFNLGFAYMEMGNREKAIEFYKRAIAIDPTYLNAYINLSVIILSPENAIVEEMNSLGTSKADDERWKFLKNERLNLYVEAEKLLIKAHNLDPNNIDVVRTLNNIYKQLKQEQKAAQFKEKLSRLE